jgi:predicted lipid-binding transport protein (Tim44 family)
MENLDVTTVVFAIVAIFVAVKLRSVLGTRTGAERRPLDTPPPPPGSAPTDNVVPFGLGRRPAPPVAAPALDRWRGFAEPGTPLAQGFDAIAAREPQFSPEGFLGGARGAYEMIVGAFAAGDTAALRRLLAPEALANFAGAIEARKAAGQTMKTTLVSIDKAEIVEARVTGRDAWIGVRFATKLISATMDAAGAVVDGSPTEVADHVDIWSFSRPVGSRDPNWLLTATETVH